MKTLIHHFRDDKGTRAETLSVIVSGIATGDGQLLANFTPPPPLVTVPGVFAKFIFFKVASRLFPSSLGPLYQNEVKCYDMICFDMEMIFHSLTNKTHFIRKVVLLASF